MTTRLIRVDRNGTKYYEDDTCPKCGGTGHLPEYEYVEGGVCFLCEGTGKHVHRWTVRTPEYSEKLAARRLARAKKHAPERNQAFLEKNGFSEDGTAWVVLGNTYPIKDQLKEAGAKFDPILGWHFDHETEYEAVEVSVDNVTKKDQTDAYVWGGREAMDYVADLKAKQTENGVSEWIGETGDKIQIKAKHTACHTYETHYTYSGETNYIYTFEDEGGNVMIWKTQSWQDIETGQTYMLKGTVKAHDEYKGTKQTVLTRCKVGRV